MVSIYYSIILFKLFKLNLMKKTYNVYSFLEKTRVTTGFRSIAMMFVFIVCFLSYSSDASAQTFNTNPNTGATAGKFAAVDLSVVKEYSFDVSNEDALEALSAELEGLIDQDPPQGAVAEPKYASEVFFLNNLTENIRNTTDVATSFQLSYQSLANHAESTYSVGVDVEGIFRTYAALIN